MELQSQSRDPNSTTDHVNTPADIEAADGDAVLRKQQNKLISNGEALMHLVKATIGGGFFAMPYAFHNSGMMIGITGVIILGLSVLDMMSSIVRFSQSLRSGKYAATILLAEQDEKNAAGKATRADDTGGSQLSGVDKKSKELILPPMDYPTTVYHVFKYGARGSFARWASIAKSFTSILLVATYYGVNIIYVCIIAKTCKQLIDQHTEHAPADVWYSLLHDLSIRWYPLMMSILIIPVGMIKSMKYLVPFSVISNNCMLAGTVAIFYFIFFDKTVTPLQPEEEAKWAIWSLSQWSLFAGSALCSMEGVGMLLHVENTMARPLELAGPPSYTLHQSMIIIVILNGALGLCGYLRYGDRSEDNISLNLPENNLLSDAVKAMIGVGILLTYGLQLNVTAQIIWTSVRGKLNQVSGQNYYTPLMDHLYYVMRLLLIIGTIIVGTIVPDIGPLVSLVGAVGFSLLGIIVPVIMEIIWYWYPEDDENQDEPECDKQKSKKAIFLRLLRLIKHVLFLVIALFALIGGAYYNILDIFNNVKVI